MTKRTISYATFIGQERIDKVLEDIVEYMGKDQFETANKLFKGFTKEQMSINKFEQYCSIAGVYGYPVTAWYQTLYGATVEELINGH